jgi:hypothetical protein
MSSAPASRARLRRVPVSADRFAGTFTAPPNTGPVAAAYGVTVAARDDIGQESTVGAGTFTDAPTPAGIDIGHVTVVRTDGRQPRLGAVLIGLTTRRG